MVLVQAGFPRRRIVPEPVEQSMRQMRIVLVEPSHPGNIGAAARAIKTMGLTELHLVKPLSFPAPEATALASGAGDVLDGAVVHDSLATAVADCSYVLGCSARGRSLPWPTMTPRDACRLVLERPRDETMALLFGRERSGLDNRELECCNALVHIPTNEGFSSLNLAAAVQVIAYELRLQWLSQNKPVTPGSSRPVHADAGELARLYEHLESVLVRIGFLDPENPRFVMRRLKRLLGRANLERTELNILRGILTAVERTRYWRRPPGKE